MNKIVYWVPSLCLMMLIFFLSSQQRVEVSKIYAVQFLFFKTLHVLEYGLLYLLNYYALANTNKREIWKNRFDSLLLTVAYGISDEIHQLFVPTREGRFRDVMIDTLGASLMAIYLWKLLPKAPKQLRSLVKKLQLI